MRLYRVLRGLGLLALLLLAAELASLGMPQVTLPGLLRVGGYAVPALALLLLGRALKRAQKALATPRA